MHFLGKLAQRSEWVERRAGVLAFAVAALFLLLFGSSFNVAFGTTPPTNSIPPKVTGTYSVGSTLSATDGTWSNISGTTTTRQWQSSSDGVTWTEISGATNSTYVLTSFELGKFIRFKIVQATSNGTTHAFSPATSGTSFSSPSKSGEVSLKFRDNTSLGLSDATYGNGSCDRNSLVFRANNTLVATLNSPSERITVLLYNDDIAESFKVIYSDSTWITYTTSSPIYAQINHDKSDWSYPRTFETRSGTDVNVFLQAPAGLTITGFEIRWNSESRITCQGLKELSYSTYRSLAAIASNAPTSLSGTAGNGSATISFTAPSSNGGANISNYKYSTNGSTYIALSPANATSPITIPGLTNGTTYSITLKAVNSAGDSTASSAVSVTPFTTPGAPTSLSAVAGNGSASISFTAPSSSGGSPVTNYKYSTDGSTYTELNPSDATSPITIPGLTNGSNYSITLKAVNAAGDSVASASVSVTPDGNAPTASVTAATILATQNASVQSSEAGTAYLVNETVTVTNLASITGAADNLQNSVSITTANTNTNLAATGLVPGTYKLYTIDGAGNLSAASTNTISIKPATPGTPDLDAGSDLGTSNEDNSTSDDTPTFSVPSILSGANVTVTATPASGSAVTCIFPSSSGSCTFTSLSNGTYSITAVQSFGGVNSDTSTALANVVISKIAISTPATPDLQAASDSGRSNSDDITNDNTPTIDVSGNFGGTVTVTATKESSNVSCTLSSGAYTCGTLANGVWSITVTDTDSAGNSATSSALLITIDTVAPSALTPTSPIYVTPGTNIQIQSPEIGTAQLRNALVGGSTLSSVVNVDVANSSYTVQVPAAYNNQCYKLYVFDLAGNARESSSTEGLNNPAFVCAAPVIAPTSLVATPGNGSVSISFTQPAPTDSTTYPIVNYYYSLDGTNFTALSPASATSPISISGLTNGTAYSITLKAYYGPSGNRNSSNSSAAVSLTLPAAPTVNANDAPDNLASPGSFKVGDTLTNKMTFNGAPTPTLSYQYFRCPTNVGVLASDYISNGCVDIPGATSSTYILTGDDVGKYMGVKVTATNSSGTQVLTPKRNTLVTANSPGVPTSVSATITGSTTASVAFTAPASNGASITDYDLQYSSNNGSSWSDFDNGTSTVNPILVTGLTANTSYVFRIKAKNSTGFGSFSVASTAQTTHAAPTIASTPGTATFPRLSNDVFEEFEGPGPSTGITVTVNGVTTPISTDPATGNVSIAPKASSWTSTATYGSLSGYMLNFYNSMLAPVITFPSGVSQFRFLVAGLAVQPTILLTYTNGTSDTLTLNTGGSEGAPYVITITAPSGKFINSFRITPPSQDWWHLDNISYVAALSTTISVSSQSLTAGTAATSFTPITASGGGSSKTYSISPSLPSGLSLNTSTGAITGTPTGASPSTSYTVSVTDGTSTSTASFTLGVNAALSSSTGTVPSGVYKDVAVTAFTPISFSGGTSPISYAVLPSLPAGLTLNTSTGVISGTATGTSPNTTYTVTATDANGDSEASTFAFAVTNQPTAPAQNNNNGGGGGGGGSPAPEPAPEPVCNAACVAAQNAAAERAAAERAAVEKAAAEKVAAEKLTADKAAAVAVAEKTKVDVSAAATAATAAVEKATAAAAAKVDVDTVAAAVSTIVNSTNSSAAITNKITNEAAASISSAPAAATKAASTASANTKANSAASQVRAAATAAQKAATSSQAQTSAAPEISLGSSNTGSAAAQAAARANAAARAGKAAANEVAATAEAKAVESKATATALQNEANAAVAEAIAEQKVATELAVEAKAAADKASTLSAEKIAATTAAKTAAEILVELLKEKVTVAEKIAAAVTVEALAEAQKSLDTVNAKIAEAERTVAETASKADAAISAQVEAVRVAEAAKASAEAQLAKVDQLNAVVPVKAAAAVRAASVAAVDTKIATAAKAAAAKVPSKAVISAKPGASTGKNSTRATISGLKPGQKVKVTVNVKPKP